MRLLSFLVSLGMVLITTGCDAGETLDTDLGNAATDLSGTYSAPDQYFPDQITFYSYVDAAESEKTLTAFSAVVQTQVVVLDTADSLFVDLELTLIESGTRWDIASNPPVAMEFVGEERPGLVSRLKSWSGPKVDSLGWFRLWNDRYTVPIQVEATMNKVNVVVPEEVGFQMEGRDARLSVFPFYSEKLGESQLSQAYSGVVTISAVKID
jgi:hypothetical protein